MKTQNSTINPELGNKMSWGERWASWCVCVQYWNVIDLWKPKTGQQTFLDSFSVLQFGACRIVRWTSNIFLCVYSGINRVELKGYFSGDHFSGDYFSEVFFQGTMRPVCKNIKNEWQHSSEDFHLAQNIEAENKCN